MSVGIDRHTITDRTEAPIDLLMARPPYIPELPKAKESIGLNVLYEQVASDFLKKWEPEPIVSATPLSPEELKDKP